MRPTQARAFFRLSPNVAPKTLLRLTTGCARRKQSACCCRKLPSGA